MRNRTRSDAFGSGPATRRGIQIGPKIRVGGTLGKIGEGIKKVVPSVGALIGGAALGGVGSVLGSKASGVNPLDDAKKGAALALPIAAGATALSGSGSGGSAGGDIPGGDDPTSDNMGGLDPETEAAVAAAPGGSDMLAKLKAGVIGLSDVLDFAKKYVPTAVDLLAAKAAHDRQAQSDKYAQQGLALAQQTYAENKPLRDAGRSGLLSAGAYKPDLTKLQSVADQGGTGKPLTLPMAGAPSSSAPPGQGHVLPIANGPPAPTPTPSGGFPKMPVPGGDFGSQFQGPASQLPQPTPGGPTGMVPGIGAGGPLVPKPGVLPIAGGPPNPTLRPNQPTLPFATGYQ